MSHTQHAGLASREVDRGRKGHKKGREDGGGRQEETGRHLPGRLRSNEKNKDNMKSAHKGLSLAD